MGFIRAAVIIKWDGREVAVDIDEETDTVILREPMVGRDHLLITAEDGSRHILHPPGSVDAIERGEKFYFPFPPIED